MSPLPGTRRAVFRKAASFGFAALLLLAGPSLPLLGARLCAGEWAGWRGPEASGFSRENQLPGSFEPEPGGKNLLWRQDTGARSAPVVLDDRVILLNLAGEGPTRQERVMCFQASTGKVLWEHRFNVFFTDIPDRRVGWSNPAADPETGYVYVHGVQGLLKCLGRDGELIWERSLTEEFGRISGYGGRTHTPLIDEDRVVLSFLNSSWGPQARGLHRYVAFDKRTGAVRWWTQTESAPLDTTYSCPVTTVVNGQRLLIAGAADGWVYGFQARTGKLVWKFHLSKRGINSSVVARDGKVWVCHSEENIDKTEMGRVVCIKSDGVGDVTKTHEVWRQEGITAGYASVALDEKHCYVVDNSANVHCMNAETGEKLWEISVGTAQRGSPAIADGKLYVGSMNGMFSIIGLPKEGEKEAKLLDRHEFLTEDGRIVEINGSPAIAGGRVFFATTNHLYALGNSPWKGKTGPLPKPPAESPVSADPKPAWLQVRPAEMALLPGQEAYLRVELFNSRGQSLGESQGATWSLAGVPGEITKAGRLTVGGEGFAAGLVKATLGDLSSSARVRVVPPLPLKIDFEELAGGATPAGWIGASKVKFGSEEIAGSKAFTKFAKNPKFLISNVYFGLPTWSNYTIQADVLGTETRRQMPNVALLAQRYNLSLMGNTQRLRLVSWAPMRRVEVKERFKWDPDTWYQLKLRVDPKKDGTALVRGKAWPRGEKEPEAWTVELTDPIANTSGSPGFQGYSAGTTDQREGAKIYWDNVLVTPN